MQAWWASLWENSQAENGSAKWLWDEGRGVSDYLVYSGADGVV
jgi:hypothetical protein